MQASDIPSKFPIVFGKNATSGFIRSIPQTSSDPNAASLSLGFPPNTFTPVAGGGAAPNGEDFNGILQQLSAWCQWQAAGLFVPYDSSFQTSIGGYPNGAVVASLTTAGLYWRSTADNNATNPDTGGAGWASVNRIRLAANTTFFVSTTGSDSSGNGTSGSPWATLQHAWDVVQENYDLNGFVATIQLANGTYTGGLIASGPMTGALGPQSLVINGGTPSSVIISTSGAAHNAISAENDAQFTISGIRLAASGAGADGIFASLSNVNFSNVDFGACNNAQIHAISNSLVVATGNYSISGSAAFHAFVQNAFLSCVNLTVTLSGTPNFSTAYARVQYPGTFAAYSTTFSGSATGVKFQVLEAGGIDTQTTDVNYLPGNAAGSATNPGWYV